jgi:orotate phosphoribosyltransferase
VTFEWIPRERNKHADRLANEAMDAAAGMSRVRPAPLVPEPDLLTQADTDNAAAVARAELGRRVREKALLSGEFTLRSGQVSDVYFDKYLVESDPDLLRDAVEAMTALLPDGDVVLGGLELGGIPLATLLGQRAGRAIRFVRKVAKEYGTRNQIEGGPVDGLRVVLIEDVITSGGAVLAAVDAVRAAGGSVDTVVCLIDRQQGGRSALVAKGLDVRAALSAADLA